MCLLIFVEFNQMKNKSITKFGLLVLSEYQVDICWTREDKLRSKKSTISSKVSLWIEWKGYKGSQSLSLILKLPAIIKIFQISASVLLRYFKVDW